MKRLQTMSRHGALIDGNRSNDPLVQAS